MIRKKEPTSTIVLDLDGPEGNVFNIIGTATMLGRNCGYKEDDIKTMVEEMKSGDYINALTVFNKNFGSFVVMETTNEEYLEAFG